MPELIDGPTPEMMVEHLDGQVQTLLRENERLRAALQRIDGINDNPAHYNQEINEVCDRILRPDLVG